MTRVAQRPPAILHPTTGTVAMFEHRLQRLTVLFPLTVAILLAGQAAAADGPLVRFLTDDVANPEYWLTQTQPEEPALEHDS